MQEPKPRKELIKTEEIEVGVDARSDASQVREIVISGSDDDYIHTVKVNLYKDGSMLITEPINEDAMVFLYAQQVVELKRILRGEAL